MEVIPFAYAHLKKAPEVFLWVVPFCPICGAKHTHGGGPRSGDPRVFLGHRMAHCGERAEKWIRASGYVLTDRPELHGTNAPESE